jgi:hypothetical protein
MDDVSPSLDLEDGEEKGGPGETVADDLLIGMLGMR